MLILELVVQVYLERFPQFVGRTFGSITFQLPDGIPFGIVNHFRYQKCTMMNYEVNSRDGNCVLRMIVNTSYRQCSSSSMCETLPCLAAASVTSIRRWAPSSTRATRL